MKRNLIIAGVVTAIAVALSAIWHVPYVFTLIGFFAWAFFGHLLTADDDTPRESSGAHPFPWRSLAIQGAILAGLCVLEAFVPALRGLGGSR